MKKYEFTGRRLFTNAFDNRWKTIRQIRAVREFSTLHGVIKTGCLGGWIEDERNLSHKGNCWVNPDSVVCGMAKIMGNGYLSSSIAIGNAVVTDDARIYAALLAGNVICSGNASVHEGVKAFGHTVITDAVSIYGSVWLSGDILLGGAMVIRGDFHVYGCGTYYGFGDAETMDAIRNISEPFKTMNRNRIRAKADREVRKRNSDQMKKIQEYQKRTGNRYKPYEPKPDDGNRRFYGPSWNQFEYTDFGGGEDSRECFYDPPSETGYDASTYTLIPRYKIQKSGKRYYIFDQSAAQPVFDHQSSDWCFFEDPSEAEDYIAAFLSETLFMKKYTKKKQPEK